MKSGESRRTRSIGVSCRAEPVLLMQALRFAWLSPTSLLRPVVPGGMQQDGGARMLRQLLPACIGQGPIRCLSTCRGEGGQFEFEHRCKQGRELQRYKNCGRTKVLQQGFDLRPGERRIERRTAPAITDRKQAGEERSSFRQQKNHGSAFRHSG